MPFGVTCAFCAQPFTVRQREQDQPVSCPWCAGLLTIVTPGAKSQFRFGSLALWGASALLVLMVAQVGLALWWVQSQPPIVQRNPSEVPRAELAMTLVPAAEDDRRVSTQSETPHATASLSTSPRPETPSTEALSPAVKPEPRPEPTPEM